jgi:MFS family permease
MIRTDIPARLDRLPWSGWHWRIVLALGVTWLLDGLEVTLVGSLSGILQRSDTLGLSAAQIGWAGSGYISGAVCGALLFGRLADRWGRRRLFLVTLGVYVASTMLTAAAFGFVSFVAFRFLTGIGIGGEYAAINSAIDELIPARVRGRVDLAINGTFWLGAAAGALLSLALTSNAGLDAPTAWRVAFLSGGVLGAAVLLVRRNLPESPRWLVMRGRHAEARRVVESIEAVLTANGVQLAAVAGSLEVHDRPPPGWLELARVLLVTYRRRTLLGASLMIAQAFFYNAIFFTYGLVLTEFYGVPAEKVGAYILPFAISNFLGPFLLGHLFDVVGRRVMIACTYALAGLGLFGLGYAFMAGWLSAVAQTVGWAAIFFVASAAASSAYLTVSEVFPLEIRAISIALFYAIGTALGGAAAPVLFGMLIESHSRRALFFGYALGAILMIGAAVLAAFTAVAAERRSLEEIAAPLGAAGPS